MDPIKGKTTLFSLASIQIEIQDLTGIKTDVLTPLALHERFRDSVIAEATRQHSADDQITTRQDRQCRASFCLELKRL